ncbi:hypothetical protein [Nonomuraea dietziae]
MSAATSAVIGTVRGGATGPGGSTLMTVPWRGKLPSGGVTR